MSDIAPPEIFAPEDSLAGNEALPLLFDSIVADEPKQPQADAPEPDAAPLIDDGLDDDEEQPRLLTRAQKKLGKARISRPDLKADENYSPRGSSAKGGKKKKMGKRGSQRFQKPVIARKPVPTIIPVKEVPFLYERILAALPQVEKQYYDSYAIQNLTICSILEVEKYAHEEDPENALFNDLVKIVIADTSNKYKLTARQKNGRVDAGWTKSDIGRDPMEVLSRYNELMTSEEEKAKRSYRAHNPERKDWTATDLKRFREAFLKYGAGPTSNKKIAQFMGIHPNQIAYMKQRIRRLARQREIETEFDRAAFEMVKDMKNVPDKVLFKHLREKLTIEDEENKANKAAARKAKKNAGTTLDNETETSMNGDLADEDMNEEPNVPVPDSDLSVKDSADSVPTANSTVVVLQEDSPKPLEQLIILEGDANSQAAPKSPPVSRSADVSPTTGQRKRTKPQSAGKQLKRRKTETTPPKTPRASSATSPEASHPAPTSPAQLSSPTNLSSAATKTLSERDLRLLKRKQSTGRLDASELSAVAVPSPAQPPESLRPVTHGTDLLEQSRSGDEEPIMSDTPMQSAPEPLSSSDTNGPVSTPPSEPVTPREPLSEPRGHGFRTASEINAESMVNGPVPSPSQPSLPRVRLQGGEPAARQFDYVPELVVRAPLHQGLEAEAMPPLIEHGPELISRYATPHQPAQAVPRTNPTAPRLSPKMSSAPTFMTDNTAQNTKPLQWVTEPLPPGMVSLSQSLSPPGAQQYSLPTLMYQQAAHSMAVAMSQPVPSLRQYAPQPQGVSPSHPMNSSQPRYAQPVQSTPNPSMPFTGYSQHGHSIPIGTPLTALGSYPYGYQQAAPNFLPMTQMTNTPVAYNNYSGGPQYNTVARPKQSPSAPQSINPSPSPREFEASLTPFLINSPAFSGLNANPQFTSRDYSQPAQTYDPRTRQSTFVPYNVNNNAK